MSIYKPRGSRVWVMDFMFHGQRIRESTEQTSKTRAQRVVEERKTALREGTAGIRTKKRPDLLSTAAERWREGKEAKGKWSPSMVSIVRYSLGHLLPVLGKRLLVDIEASDIRAYQEHRQAEGASARTINIETSMLRQIMRRYGAWARISGEVGTLKERTDVGRKLTIEQERILLVECERSVSRALLPFVSLALATGARFDTIRTLRWANVDFAKRALTFGKDKTEAGSGRTIPMNLRAFETLKFWASEFPDREPSHFVFPSERYGLHGAKGTFGGTVKAYDYDPAKPVGTIQSAWRSARQRTRRHCLSCDGLLIDRPAPAVGFICDNCKTELAELPEGLAGLRFHDLRHTAVSRMIANRVPLPKIAKIVGWSNSTTVAMASRYGHFSVDDLRDDMETLSADEKPTLQTGSPQFSPQSNTEQKSNIN